MDAESLKEWQSLFRLWSNDKGIKLRLAIPDTVLLQHGLPTAWFYTSKEGYVVQQPAGRASIQDIKAHFLRCSLDSGEEWAAILRLADGLPKLLSRQAFSALCDRLAAQLEGSDALAPEETPVLLQSWVPPCLDLRYVTSYTNAGANISCHTFQRRFSRRYLPFREAAAPGLLPGILAGASAVAAVAAQEPGSSGGEGSAAEAEDASTGPAAHAPVDAAEVQAGKADAAATQPAPTADATADENGLSPLASTSSNLPAEARAAAEPPAAAALPAAAAAPPPPAPAAAAAAPAEEGESGSQTVRLGERALADMERSLDKALGPVDPSLKMAMRKAAQGLVQYVQRAHLLTIKGLVCEFVRDAWGNITFMGPLQVDWASVIPGRGGEPWANTNLTATAQEEESWPPSAASSEDEVSEGRQQHAYTVTEPSTAEAGSASSGGPAHGSAVTIVGEVTHSVTVVGPAGQRHTRTLSQQRVQHAAAASLGLAADCDSLSPLVSLPPLQQAPSQPDSPLIGALHPATASLGPSSNGMGLQPTSPLRAGGKVGTPGAAQQQQPPPQQQRRDRSPAHARPLGNSLCSLPRSSPAMLTSHLTKELVTVKDELIVKSDLAEQLEDRVQTLEHDKRVITDAFERVLHDMQRDMREVKERLERLRLERDSLVQQLQEERAGRSAAEAERDDLRSRLDEERGTAISSLGSLQAQQEDAHVRAARAEEQLKALEGKLHEEQAVSDALKKQMVFYTHAMATSGLAADLPGSGAGGAGPALRAAERPELRYWETLAAVEDLLLREADADGERYSLAKVLHTCQADLHPIFLHYCLLDAGFAKHWPPQLTLGGWLTFMKETGVTNLVPGIRTRSDTTIHVQEAQEVFRRYSLRQAIVGGGAGTAVAGLASKSSAAGSGSAAAAAGAGAALEGARPATASSNYSGTGRPASPKFSGAHLSYQGFCAALVHVAAKTARQSAETLDAVPFLSEQVRAYVDSIVPKAQRVLPLGSTGTFSGASVKKAGGAGQASAAGGQQKGGSGAGGAGAGARAKQAAAQVSKVKKSRPKEETEAVAEASRELSLRQGLG